MACRYLETRRKLPASERMPLPKQVSKKLHQTMGEDAGGPMSEWLDELEETSRGTRAALDGIEAQLVALREEMRAGFSEISIKFAQVDVRFAQVEAGMEAKFARVDAHFAEVHAKIAGVSERTAQQIADTFTWAVPIWLASLGAIIGVMTWLMRGAR